MHELAQGCAGEHRVFDGGLKVQRVRISEALLVLGDSPGEHEITNDAGDVTFGHAHDLSELAKG